MEIGKGDASCVMHIEKRVRVEISAADMEDMVDRSVRAGRAAVAAACAGVTPDSHCCRR